VLLVMFWGFGGFGGKRTIGCVILIVGIVIMICSTPLYLWCSFIGLALIIIGICLLRRGYY